MMDFILDSRLQRDTVVIGQWPLSMVLLMNESQYPWLILVPRCAGVSEMYQLDNEDQIQLAKESSLLAKTMAHVLQPRKMNVANLGNIVSQLHVHHIARFDSDKAWPGPVWGKYPVLPFDAAQLAEKKSFWHQRLNAVLAFSD